MGIKSKKIYLLTLFSLIILVVLSINIVKNLENQIDIEVVYKFEKLDQAKYDKFFEGLNQFGIRYTINEGKDYNILRLSKNYANISDISLNNFFPTPNTSTSCHIANHLLISTNYEIKGNIYLVEDEREGYINYANSNEITDVMISMKIPYKISEHNANIIIKETNELIWYLDLGKENDIKFTILDYNNSLIFGLLVLLLLITLITFGYFKRIKTENFSE